MTRCLFWRLFFGVLALGLAAQIVMALIYAAGWPAHWRLLWLPAPMACIYVALIFLLVLALALEPTPIAGTSPAEPKAAGQASAPGPLAADHQPTPAILPRSGALSGPDRGLF